MYYVQRSICLSIQYIRILYARMYSKWLYFFLFLWFSSGYSVARYGSFNLLTFISLFLSMLVTCCLYALFMGWHSRLTQKLSENDVDAILNPPKFNVVHEAKIGTKLNKITRFASLARFLLCISVCLYFIFFLKPNHFRQVRIQYTVNSVHIFVIVYTVFVNFVYRFFQTKCRSSRHYM